MVTNHTTTRCRAKKEIKNPRYIVMRHGRPANQGVCRAKREMKDPKAITMKNGRLVTQGVCPTCGTKTFRIGKA